jgi:hypothetical protein
VNRAARLAAISRKGDSMETVISIARHGGQLLAGILTTRGIIEGSMQETVIGIVVSLATLAWYLWDRSRNKTA